ncbi:MAG: M20/M25/M40 family metallo-hydrolase [Myxococcota bacterium]
MLAAHRRLAGEVHFMFQPGEEAQGGADVMLEEGLPDFDGAFALHVAPQIPTGMIGTKPGPIMASFDGTRCRGARTAMRFDATFRISPVPIACEIVTALQSFVTRRVGDGSRRVDRDATRGGRAGMA